MAKHQTAPAPAKGGKDKKKSAGGTIARARGIFRSWEWTRVMRMSII